MSNKHKVLFVCIHNSARSQMAEAFLKKYGGDAFEAREACEPVREADHPRLHGPTEVAGHAFERPLDLVEREVRRARGDGSRRRLRDRDRAARDR